MKDGTLACETSHVLLYVGHAGAGGDKHRYVAYLHAEMAHVHVLSHAYIYQIQNTSTRSITDNSGAYRAIYAVNSTKI